MVSRSASRVIAILAILLFITFFAISIRDWPDSTMMADTGVIHIVHFQFKAGTTESEKKEVCYIFAQIRGRDLGTYGAELVLTLHAHAAQVAREMLALKDRCLNPATGKPYIKSFSGGKDNSPEGMSVSSCRRKTLCSARPYHG